MNFAVGDLAVTVEFSWITPAVASEMLTRNTHNRSLRVAAHNRYVRDMANGDWNFTGAPITFDFNGVLLDGQNRLTAIVESGVTLPCLIVLGLAPEAQDDTDTGIHRKFADVLTLRGESNANALGSIVRRVAEWEKGLRSKTTKVMSNSELTRVLEAHPELREYPHVGQRVSRACHGISPTTASLAKWVLDQIDRDDSEFFFDRLRDGQGLVTGDPIYALRENFRRAEKQRGQQDQFYMLAILFKAWNAYRQARQVQFITWKPGGSKPEQFPEPI